ncbi:hypothetical protein GOP47_0022373 [Adiantum capillus-veneris]|uniref:MLO-like protein n=1 Tax=Adiantum capillus-veneris TaxID=13818 RepID=A0A9D4U576_ADICA|nr:hypothetical protein GOP47_0022373 [Adiantum capillus-veneris]
MAEETPALLNTPTWAIACTCAVFILISLIAERAIFFIGRIASNYNKAALLEAFEKIKEELIMVGFISIALTVGQNWFTKICVPSKWSTIMLLCSDSDSNSTESVQTTEGFSKRILASTEAVTESCKEGHVLFMSPDSIHELHILIFILALVHIVYTVVIVVLGMWVVSHWKAWEQRAATKELLSAHGGVRIVRDTSFVRARAANKWIRNPILAYVVAFFQQFYSTVTEIDYITLRYGFVKSHLAESSPFNFHKYIQRSFQEDFKHVVGISPGLWAYTVFWLLINVHGWETSIFVTLIPLLLLLAVGTKMQVIITKMAIQMADQHAVVLGMPLVKPNDNLFWFARPRFILHCLHFILFQNALEISFDIWAAVSFPPHNCLYGHPSSLVRRLVIGIVVQMVCGVVTLPIYALVSQMGSSVKRTVFEEHIQLALKRWHKRAKENTKKDDKTSTDSDAEGTSQEQPLAEDSVSVETEIVVHGPRSP